MCVCAAQLKFIGFVVIVPANTNDFPSNDLIELRVTAFVCLGGVCTLRVSGVTIIVKTLLMLSHKFVAYCAFAKVIFSFSFRFCNFFMLSSPFLASATSVCNELKSVLSIDIIQSFFNLTVLLCEEFLISLI